MDIQTEKIELVKRILETENPRIIESIKNIFKKERAIDFWDELTPYQQGEIKKGDSDIDQSKSVDYESLMVKHR